MIGTTDETVFASFVEIGLEHRVDDGCTFGRLDHHETYRTALDHGIAQPVPIDVALIMAYVYTMNLVATGVLRITVQGAPSESSPRASKRR